MSYEEMIERGLVSIHDGTIDKLLKIGVQADREIAELKKQNKQLKDALHCIDYHINDKDKVVDALAAIEGIL